jgi:hypothetical protein
MTNEEEVMAKGLIQENPVLFNAMVHHRTHRAIPLDFEAYPYLRQIYADTSHHLGVLKSTQCGLSEYVVAREIAKAISGQNIFHVLPTDKLIGRFVKERFDKTIQSTPYYKSVLKEMEGSSNITMKQIGKGTIAFVGSNSAVSFTEFPADDGIIDELDRCDQKNILMVEDRLANSKYRTRVTIGNPSITEFGIHKLFKESKQWEWFIKCPKCGKWFHPDFMKHAVREVSEGVWTYVDEDWEPDAKRDPVMLHDCGQEINRKQDGQWVATFPEVESSFYHIGKEFSTQVTMRELCAAFSRGLDDEAAMARFYNSDLGLPYTPKGSKLTDDDLNQAVSDYLMPTVCPGPCVLGIDVGTRLHTIVSEITGDGRERLVFIGYLKEEQDVFNLFTKYNIVAGVIDRLPEQRLVQRIVSIPQMWSCTFSTIRQEDRIDPRTKNAQVYRTGMLDEVIAKVREKRVLFPRNAASLPEFYDHLKANTRVFNEDRQEYEYLGENPDHLMFAFGYACVARRMITVIRGAA